MEQMTLLGEVRETTLTERQEFALRAIEAEDGGLASDELVAVMHERRGKHDRGVRCSWCSTEGKGVAGELRKKGLAVRRRSGLWQSLRPLDSGSSIGAEGPESSGAGVGERAGSGSAQLQREPERPHARQTDDRPATTTDPWNGGRGDIPF